MIRVPFFSSSRSKFHLEYGGAEWKGEMPAVGSTAPEDRIEARLSSLEHRLVSHAEELKIQVSERMMRIQSRVEGALRPFQSESEPNGGGADNVIEFGGVSDHQLRARNAHAAMRELNETLRFAQEHLEAISGSIERMRRSAAAGR